MNLKLFLCGENEYRSCTDRYIIQKSSQSELKPWILWVDSGSISPMCPYYSRDCRSTSHVKTSPAKDRWDSRSPVRGFEWLLYHRRVFQIHKQKNHNCSPHIGQQNRPWPKPFEYTVLSSYFMNINGMLTR